MRRVPLVPLLFVVGVGWILFGTHCEARPRAHRKLRLAPEGQGFEGQFIVQVRAPADTISAVSNNGHESRPLRRGDASNNDAVRQITLGLEHAIVKHTFAVGEHLRGFTVSNLVHDDDFERLLHHENVLLVEQDQRVHTYGRVEQYDPPWGLDRLDQPNAALDDLFEYELTGAGVKVFVVDTGILANHEDFSGRVTCGFDAWDKDCEDKDGHGTHMAGSIGGTTKGVAKDVQLISVKIASSESGLGSDLLEGIQFIQGEKANDPSQPMVANLSVGLGPEGRSDIINDAVDALVNQGVVVIVASGNYQSNACQSSPASASRAITVAASDKRDNFYAWSSFGNCVDLIAPGKLITSNWFSSTSSTNTISGTSSAAAHVAGVAALLLEQDPTRSPDDVRDAILADALVGTVKGNLQKTPNLLLNTQALLVSSPGSSVQETCTPPFLGFIGCDCCQDSCFLFLFCFG